MQALSKRLALIASLVNSGERVADIGTDHAYLPIFLRQTGKSPYVLACDIKMSPLKSAMKNVKDCGCDGIDFRLCDGLLGVNEEECDTVVIAGIGGECIASILAACKWKEKAKKRFLLQPMNSPELLREFLQEGHTILSERAVTDMGRTYTVIEAVAQKDTVCRPEGFQFTGLLSPALEDDRLFLEKQLLRLEGCYNAIKDIEDKKDEAEYYFSACESIKKRLIGE